MSGIGMVAASGPTVGGGPPPPDPLFLNSFTWNGPTPTQVSGSSGTTNNVFSSNFGGGVAPLSVTFTVLSNPSGKLSVALGSVPPIDYSGFTLNEVEVIGVRITVQDSTGARLSADSAAQIKRTS